MSLSPLLEALIRPPANRQLTIRVTSPLHGDKLQIRFVYFDFQCYDRDTSSASSVSEETRNRNNSTYIASNDEITKRTTKCRLLSIFSQRAGDRFRLSESPSGPYVDF